MCASQIVHKYYPVYALAHIPKQVYDTLYDFNQRHIKYTVRQALGVFLAN